VQTIAGGCGGIVPMAGSATIVVNPLPAAFTLTSSAPSYCAGGAGVSFSLLGSAVGVNYQLLRAGSPVGSPVAGTGGTIGFGTFTGAGPFTVRATNATTGCTALMTGSITITISPLPTVYSVTGGGTYCTGSLAAIGLSFSQVGVKYQLW